MKYKILYTSIKIIGILFGIVSVVRLQQIELKSNNQYITKQDYINQEIDKKTKLSLISQLPSFGLKNLIADWTYLQFLQYFGNEESRSITGYSLAPKYFAEVVNRDPKFIKAYFLLSPATSIFAGEAERGVEIITEGLKSVTANTSDDAYYIWTYKAVDELLFLGDVESARKSYLMASKWAESSDLPTAKDSVVNTKRTAQFLAKNPDSLIARIGAWTMVLNSSNDTKTQDKALEKIQELGGQIIINPDDSVKIRVPENAT